MCLDYVVYIIASLVLFVVGIILFKKTTYICPQKKCEGGLMEKEKFAYLYICKKCKMATFGEQVNNNNFLFLLLPYIGLGNFLVMKILTVILYPQYVFIFYITFFYVIDVLLIYLLFKHIKSYIIDVIITRDEVNKMCKYGKKNDLLNYNL